jgi:hypothetical protein
MKVFFEIFLRSGPESEAIFSTPFLWVSPFSHSFLLGLSQVVHTESPSHGYLRDPRQCSVTPRKPLEEPSMDGL